jgi:2'-5' RNA ligase
VRRTIGVAIAIPPPYADELENWREHFGDPAAHLIRAHVTLLPPTTVFDLDPAVTHLDNVSLRHPPFRVRLRGTSTFRPTSPVVYVRVADGEQQIVTLERDVRSGPLSRRLRFEYHPHVTVAHDVPDETLTLAQSTLADYRAEFDVSSITLYEMGPDGAWSPLREFPLPGSASAPVQPADG